MNQRTSRQYWLELFSRPYHFLLVIVFFLSHGFAEHMGLVPAGEILMLLGILLILALALFYTSKKLLKTSTKTAIFTSLLLLIFLFYGSIENYISGNPYLAVIGRLKRLLPIIIVFAVLIFFLIRRTKLSFRRTTFFLNTLFAIYILFDLGTILFKALNGKDRYINNGYGNTTQDWDGCDTCRRPDIYFVILDEYWSLSALKECMGYDNSGFQNYLKSNGFFIVEGAQSNYSYTIFSMASMLNADLSYRPEKNISLTYPYHNALSDLKNNKVCKYLAQQGYDIHNYSIFDLPGKPTKYYNSFVPLRAHLITNKTLYNRVIKNLPTLAWNENKKGWLNDWVSNKIGLNNKEVLEFSLATAAEKKTNPVFSYVHLMMPHAPFLFDSMGNKLKAAKNITNPNLSQDQQDYLQYLAYTNQEVKKYIANLLEATGHKAVILLMSDHGLRVKNPCRGKMYEVLNAVFLPGQDYSRWYPGVSNGNQFGILFNTLFDAKIPMIKDTTIF